MQFASIHKQRLLQKEENKSEKPQGWKKRTETQELTVVVDKCKKIEYEWTTKDMYQVEDLSI
jgi:hypothetical protein